MLIIYFACLRPITVDMALLNKGKNLFVKLIPQDLKADEFDKIPVFVDWK